MFDVFVSGWTLRELFPYPIEVENTAKNVVKKQPVMNERLSIIYVVNGLKLRAISKQNEKAPYINLSLLTSCSETNNNKITLIPTVVNN